MTEAVAIAAVLFACTGVVMSLYIAIDRYAGMRALTVLNRNGAARIVSQSDFYIAVVTMVMFASELYLSSTIVQTVYGAGLGAGSEVRMYVNSLVVLLLVVAQLLRLRAQSKLLAYIESTEDGLSSKGAP